MIVLFVILKALIYNLRESSKEYIITRRSNINYSVLTLNFFFAKLLNKNSYLLKVFINFDYLSMKSFKVLFFKELKFYKCQF